MTPDEDGYIAAHGWSPNGKGLVFWHATGATSDDIFLLSLEGEPTWEAIIQTDAREREPTISPDGQWIAYTSDETGQQEVYVQRFPELDRRLRISTSGGRKARWSPDGRELFYANAGSLMAVSLETAPRFRAGVPETLFETGPQLLSLSARARQHPRRLSTSSRARTRGRGRHSRCHSA